MEISGAAMDYTGVMYLTNFIRNELDDREDKLGSIYKNAVQSSDSFIELDELRKRLVFFDNGVGGTLFRECKELMQKIFEEPDRGQELLGQMKNLTKDILAEEERSKLVLHDFVRIEAPSETLGNESASFRETVGVLDRKTNDIYGDMLNKLASAIVYVLLVTGGPARINGLRWNEGNSLNVKLNIINSEMLPRLIDGQLPSIFWRIVRVQDDKAIRFCDYRYQIEYISYDDYLMYKKLFKPLNDNLFVDNQMLAAGACRTVFAGMGNLVGCSIHDCIARLSEGVLVKDDYFGTVTEENAAACRDNSIVTLLNLMSQGKLYVVSPAKACGLLNQYVNAREIHLRKNKGQCLICGKQISGRLVCREHFKTHERVYY